MFDDKNLCIFLCYATKAVVYVGLNNFFFQLHNFVTTLSSLQEIHEIYALIFATCNVLFYAVNHSVVA